MTTATLERAPEHRQSAGKGTLPRVLSGIGPDGAMSLAEHVAVHGWLPQPPRGRRDRRDAARILIDEVERSGLLGRGGAGFPLARKMRAVADARGRAIVVANGTEGEPASMKDRTLLESLPHLVIDGGVIAAEAVGADELIIAVCEEAPHSAEALARAVRERLARGGESARISVSTVPSHYVSGQETALVNHLNGGPALPTFTPPRTFEKGVKRRPTLVNNVETLAHLALLARNGSAWFRELGTAGQSGSTLVTLTGPVEAPGVYEIEQGASLSSLIEAAGGLLSPVSGALLGGYAGGWVAPASLRGVALSNEHLAVHGATLGAGIAVLLSESACPVAETARLGRWLAQHSVGQCGPCVHGLDALAAEIEQIADGSGGRGAAQRVSRLASLTAGRGACSFPDGAVRNLLSALDTFPREFTDHAAHGPCELCANAPELPLPAGIGAAQSGQDRWSLR
jgi:NADH:ubiquinone oxidoreductase subunit F (NADH-binding)